ncbi:hypothetical protein LZ32DRAFT_693286 [Colletotrichum eremochloae]|nr:hypothetical protein LZ32DRAFT_693286 [Colletotrichum eremochloae]
MTDIAACFGLTAGQRFFNSFGAASARPIIASGSLISRVRLRPTAGGVVGDWISRFHTPYMYNTDEANRRWQN